MCRSLKALLIAAVAVVSSAACAHGDEHAGPRPRFEQSKVQETAFGREGDPKKVSRSIHVDMADSMRFTPADITVRRGQTVRFVIRNQGRQMHEMVLGTSSALQEHAALMKKFPDMEHDEPGKVTLQPGKQGEIVWQFTKAGGVNFACLMPGHYEAGMKGTVQVGKK